MPSILSIEDDADLRMVIELNLRKAGHNAVGVGTALEGVKIAEGPNPPDLILLDVMLPDMSGIEVCKRLRAQDSTAQIPIIMLTARADETDRVVGFELGCDDYLAKPFHIRELILRVDAVLRRVMSPTPAHFTCANLEADWEAYKVLVEGNEVALTPLEFRLLRTLCERQGRVQSRGTLLTDVWEASSEVTTRTVDTHVRRLREKLGEASELIETVRGVGYRLKSA